MTPYLFAFDWNTDSGVDEMAAPELAATMARLDITVASKFVTIAEDILNGSIRRSINVALYPIAEWIVLNWWQLLHNSRVAEEAVPSSADAEASTRLARHNLRSAADGFVWPNLLIRRDGPIARLDWRADDSAAPGRSIRFVTSGSEIVEVGWLQDSFADLVQAVLQRLEEAGVGETPLSKEWEALRALDTDETEFCEACGRLGIDPFSEGVDLAESIEEAFGQLGPTVAWELFDAASPGSLRQDTAWIQRALAQAAVGLSNEPGRFDLRRWRGTAPTTFFDHPPYEVGYERARELRRDLGIAPTDAFPMEQLPLTISTLGNNEPPLEGVLGAQNDELTAGLVLGWERGEESRRFAAGRAVWHLLTGEGASLLTAGSSSGQRAGRAFAAELLAPAEGIRAFLKAGTGSLAVAAIAADHYRVSDLVIRHQIENQVARSS
jgi:hypothetical protein